MLEWSVTCHQEADVDGLSNKEEPKHGHVGAHAPNQFQIPIF